MTDKRIDVIDISHHNAEPDFDKMAAAGLVGVILKATEGTTYIDNTYGSRRAAARAAGLETCAYHYLKHGSISAQINHFFDVVAPVPGERVIIDYEDAACTLADLHAAVNAILAGEASLQVTVYGGSLLEQHLGNSHDALLAEKTSLWTAQYTSAAAPSWPQGTWPVYSLWQYTDGSAGGQPRTLPGMVPPLDCNMFNGSPANCKKWMAPATSQPAPGPTPTPEDAPEVMIDISTSPGVVVHVRINDEVVTL